MDSNSKNKSHSKVQIFILSLDSTLLGKVCVLVICFVSVLKDILTHPLFYNLLQSSWQTRRFRGRRTWYWRGKRRRQPGRRWSHVWMRSRPGLSPPWWKLTTRPMMPPILTSPASGLVQCKISSFSKPTLAVMQPKSLCSPPRTWVELAMM